MSRRERAPGGGEADEAEIRRRRADRLRFLQRLYELAEADVAAFQDGREIAGDLGLPEVEASRIIRYHEERGFLRHVGEGADLTVRITTEGIDYIEDLGTAE